MAKAKTLDGYREYELTVSVRIHKSQDTDRDAGILEAVRGDISELASGDVIVISANKTSVRR